MSAKQFFRLSSLPLCAALTMLANSASHPLARQVLAAGRQLF